MSMVSTRATRATGWNANFNLGGRDMVDLLVHGIAQGELAQGLVVRLEIHGWSGRWRAGVVLRCAGGRVRLSHPSVKSINSICLTQCLPVGRTVPTQLQLQFWMLHARTSLGSRD